MATLNKAAKKETSATSKVTGTETAKPVTRKRKVIKTSKKETDAKNIKDTITKVVESNREVKYIYPADIAKDSLKKKAWRAKMRDKDAAFLKSIEKLKKAKDQKALSKEEKAYKDWRKTVYLVP